MCCELNGKYYLTVTLTQRYKEHSEKCSFSTGPFPRYKRELAVIQSGVDGG
jgi:hypothetical protein